MLRGCNISARMPIFIYLFLILVTRSHRSHNDHLSEIIYHFRLISRFNRELYHKIEYYDVDFCETGHFHKPYSDTSSLSRTEAKDLSRVRERFFSNV